MDFPDDYADSITGLNWLEPSAKSFISRLNAAKGIAGAASSSFAELKENCKKRIVNSEYCKRSDLYPRGFYCPDPLEDICISNETRGRLLTTDPGDAAFRYCFDASGEMTMVISKEEIEEHSNEWNEWTELLFKIPNYRIGIECLQKTDNNRRDFIVRIETVDAEKTHYCIAQFRTVIEDGTCFIHPDIYTVVIDFKSGLPIKRTVIEEGPEDMELCSSLYCMQIVGPTAFYQMAEKKYVKKIVSTVQIEYDSSGKPSKTLWNGVECAIGRKKKPMIGGMIV